MIRHIFILLALLNILLTSSTSLLSEINLENDCSEFLLDIKKIDIPGHPHAFNPSIVRWMDKLLMSFREISQRHPKNLPSSGNELNISELWLVLLDKDFNPISTPQRLPLGDKGRTDDGRLFVSNKRLYIVYSDNRHETPLEGGYRVHIAEIVDQNETFSLEFDECLANFPGKSEQKREKNWVPFNYKGSLFLAYTINPHKILLPLIGFGSCETVCTSWKQMPWEWGDLRGGTPALAIDENTYFGFFHSCQDIATVHSDGQTVLHYVIGAYTFSSNPPFELKTISSKPIVGKGFYSGLSYEPYWKPVIVVFPCGFIYDDQFIWLAYGRQDHEIWIAKMDRKALLESLVAIE